MYSKIKKEFGLYTVYYKRPEVNWELHESFENKKNALKFKKAILKDMRL